MRVLGIPSRKVVTVFNAAHDTDANTTIEEYYTTNGEKLACPETAFGTANITAFFFFFLKMVIVLLCKDNLHHHSMHFGL